MQGYTEAPWRRFHAEVYGPDSGSADCYFTPFVRLEGGIPRSRDMRDITYGPGREKTFTVPQIIFRDISEFSILTDAVASAGYKRIDLNMGCPFVPQMKKGRGAAFPANIDNLHDIASAITNIGERISFSVKMRLGTDSPKLWRHTIEILNTVPLSHICVHPPDSTPSLFRESVPGRVWRTAGNIDTSDSFQRRHPYSVGHRLHNISISENRGSDGRTRPSGTSFTYSRMARRPGMESPKPHRTHTGFARPYIYALLSLLVRRCADIVENKIVLGLP